MFGNLIKKLYEKKFGETVPKYEYDKIKIQCDVAKSNLVEEKRIANALRDECLKLEKDIKALKIKLNPTTESNSLEDNPKKVTRKVNPKKKKEAE